MTFKTRKYNAVMSQNNRPEKLAYLDRVSSLSPYPNQLCEVPIWLPPRIAGQLHAFTWESSQWVLSMGNAKGLLTGQRSKRSAAGMPRYTDLDVLLGLTYAWNRNGRPRDGHVDVDLRDIMQWMGYGHDLTSAPYSELAAAVHRMEGVQITAYQKTDIELFKDKPHDYTFRLIQDVYTERQAAVGRPSKLTAKLSNRVMQWMDEENPSAIDFDVYAYLGRHPKTRRLPLARVLYASIARWRKADGSVDVPAGWLAERYGDRRYNIKEGCNGRLIYRDAFNPRSRFHRALTALGEAGCLGLAPATSSRGIRLIGKYFCPNDITRLEEKPKQKNIFEFSTMAIAEAAARGEPEPPLVCLSAKAEADKQTDAPPLPSAWPHTLSADHYRAALAKGWAAEAIGEICAAAQSKINPAGVVVTALKGEPPTREPKKTADYRAKFERQVAALALLQLGNRDAQLITQAQTLIASGGDYSTLLGDIGMLATMHGV